MNKRDNILNDILPALVPALMAGCAAWTVIQASGFAMSRMMVYLVVFVVSGICAAGKKGTIWAIGASTLIIGGIILITAMGFSVLRTLIAEVRANSSLSREAAAEHPGGVTAAMLITILLAAVTASLYMMRNGKGLSMILPIALMLIVLTINRDISIWTVVPGMIGCVAAFSMDRETGNSRIRMPVLLASVILVILAILISPPSGSTWEPLEKLAEKIRTLTEDYVRFSEERVAYTINEKGYDHGGMINDTIVSMLGGPADPDTSPVMRVKTDRDILLRGTIRQTYTGYSWIDERVKARYLYYDFTHAAVRNTVFDAGRVDKNTAFETVNIEVEMLGEGTSTLFVPAHMSSFNMDLSDAVYYNSTGEMFITRNVQAGDRYSLTAQVPAGEDELIRAAQQAENKNDKEYAHAQQEYTMLPSGIDSRIYELTMYLTKDCLTNAEKAFAIRNYLAQNYEYSLETGYPDPADDFVSRFLINEKKGYCSYFASAMTVMCRIAGVPARYVEGYYVHANDSGKTIVTGYNAHAWTEIYLNGIGWTGIDATAAAYSAQNGLAQEQMPTMPNSESGLGGSERTAGTDGTSDGSGEGTSGDDGADDGSEYADDFGSDGGLGNPEENSDGGSDDGSGSADGDGDSGDAGNGDSSDDGDSGDADDGDSGDDGSDNSDSEDENNTEDSESPEDEPTPTPDPNDELTPTPAPGEEPTPTPDPENRDTDPRDEKKNSSTWIWILITVLILAGLVYGSVRWVRKRLTETDPMVMCKKSRNAGKAAMIMYRAILTLLIRQGYAPMNGETPEAFAARVCQNIPNDAYERFVAAAAKSRYSGSSLTRAELEDGRDAYILFLNGMKTSERIRYDVQRVLHGIGDVESIP